MLQELIKIRGVCVSEGVCVPAAFLFFLIFSEQGYIVLFQCLNKEIIWRLSLITLYDLHANMRIDLHVLKKKK